MNVSAAFIRRPIGTTLLSLAIRDVSSRAAHPDLEIAGDA